MPLCLELSHFEAMAMEHISYHAIRDNEDSLRSWRNHKSRSSKSLAIQPMWSQLLDKVHLPSHSNWRDIL